ncbi:Hypothetical predicted protein [Podarcis lilfordi]|uniref:Snake toxin/toxin-like domain-containing protein n=1 Tax=Podarcis lilfordi TaxID=74358 RepID=A0AA35LFU9_9SAUR|nr:Hypothetical predicted protein [Podarcis lilfordi]
MRNSQAIGFLVLFCCVTARNFRCLECPNVSHDNECMVPEKQCTTGPWEFCFARQLNGPGFVHVDRGCTNKCISFVNKGKKTSQTSLCCVTDLCNNHNFWTNQ